MTIKFISLETKELESGQKARCVTFDVDGEPVVRKIALDTPQELVDARIQDLADGLALEFGKKAEKNDMEAAELTTSFKSGTVLTE